MEGVSQQLLRVYHVEGSRGCVGSFDNILGDDWRGCRLAGHWHMPQQRHASQQVGWCHSSSTHVVSLASFLVGGMVNNMVTKSSDWALDTKARRRPQLQI